MATALYWRRQCARKERHSSLCLGTSRTPSRVLRAKADATSTGVRRLMITVLAAKGRQIVRTRSAPGSDRS